VPILETERLTIRPFIMNDLLAYHRCMELCFEDGSRLNDAAAIEEARRLLQWQVLNEEMLARLYQPPYGDRAIVLKATGEVVGSVGYVPYLARFTMWGADYDTLAFGLFWMIDPDHQRKGYATEAARAMIDYAFAHLSLKRVIAATELNNVASQVVMRKLGMRLTHNLTQPVESLQVVGVLENPT
jgi:RimJ/RimL family protein N-acetyltransferase